MGGKLFLQIAGKIAKIVKIKNSCHTVSLVYLNFFCFVDSLSLYFRKTKKRSSRSYEKSFSAYEIFFNRVQYHWAVVRAAHRVKLSKLNQTGSTWTEFLSKEIVSFWVCYQQYFYKVWFYTYTTNRPDENELLNFFEGTSVHRLACA